MIVQRAASSTFSTSVFSHPVFTDTASTNCCLVIRSSVPAIAEYRFTTVTSETMRTWVTAVATGWLRFYKRLRQRPTLGNLRRMFVVVSQFADSRRALSSIHQSARV